MVAGVDAEPRDVYLEVAHFDSRFAEFVQRLEMDVVSFGMWPVQCACYLKSSHCCVQMRDVCKEMSILVCFVVVLFVNVCQQEAGELEDLESCWSCRGW